MKREPLIVNARVEKSGLPPIAAISGVMNDATNAVTRAPNAAPMTTATASSTTFPRSTKSRNSLSMGECSHQPWTSPQRLHCMIEIPKGSRNKYEWDPDLQAIKLNRFLFSSVVYPTDYGFITDTLGEGGEALDALVLTGAPTFPGCLIEVRAVGVLRMDDEEGKADKVVCVPADDPAWDEVEGVDGLPGQLRTEIEHFYSMYKQPEGKEVDVHGWEDRDVALEGGRRRPEALRRGQLVASVPLLSARGVTKSFGGRAILSGLDLELAAGARIGVLGPNGGGKSTLLRILAGARARRTPATVTRRRGLVHRLLPQIVDGRRARPRSPPCSTRGPSWPRWRRELAAGREPHRRPRPRRRHAQAIERALAHQERLLAQLGGARRRPRRGRGARAPARARARRRRALAARRASSAAASASSSRSPPASRAGPTCCCSTSPRRTST